MTAPRATKETWCRAGIELLRTAGADHITVDRLCALLKKTKGSFYHHFADLDAFLVALLRLWEHEHTERPIAVAESAVGRQRRGERLEAEVRKLDQQLDRAIRAWSMRNEQARTSVKQVDDRRIAYLASLHANQDDAVLEYAMFLGLQHLGILDQPKRAERLNARMHRAIAALNKTPPSVARRRGR